MRPDEIIEQAFLHLTFAIKLLTYVELGKVNLSEFDGEVQINLKKRNLSFSEKTFKSYDEIVTATQNNYVLSLGFSAIALDKALSSAGFPNDLPQALSDVDLRALIY